MNINNNPSAPNYIPLSEPGHGAQPVDTSGTGGVTEVNAQLLQTQFESINRTLQPKSNTQSLPAPPELDKQTISATVSGMGQWSAEQVGADIYSFMALFQKLAQTMRDTARTDRNTMLQTQVKALQDSANEMRSAAALRFAAGVVQGAMQVGGGMAQVGFSASAMSNSIKGSKLSMEGKQMIKDGNSVIKNNPNNQQLQAQAKDLIGLGQKDVLRGSGFTATGMAHQGYGQAAGSIGSGLGGIIGAGLTYAADMHDARRSELDAKAKIGETGYQDANDIMQQMQEIIRDVRDKLQSMEQAAVETIRSIARNV